MDLGKAESQQPRDAQVRAQDRSVERLKCLVQDLLCFLILFMIALLVVSAVFFLIDDWSHLQQANQKRRLAFKLQHSNGSGASPRSESMDSLQLDEHLKEAWPKWGCVMFHSHRLEKLRLPFNVTTEPPIVSDDAPLEGSTVDALGEMDKIDEVTNAVNDNAGSSRFMDYIYRPT